MTQPDLYTRVVLTRHVPEAHLKQGDMAMYLDYLPVTESEAGAILEVFHVLGDTIAVVTVPISAIAPLRADYVPSVRLLEDAPV